MALKFKVSHSEVIGTLPMETVQALQNVVPLVEPTNALTNTQVLTQEYITLWKQIEAIDGKNVLKKMEAIRKTLADVANTMDAKKPVVFSCPEGEIQFSARGTDTTIKAPMSLINALQKKFGTGVAWSVVNIALTPLRQILSPLELKVWIEETEGPRKLEDVRLTEKEAV